MMNCSQRFSKIQQSSWTLTNPAASQMQEIDVQFGMHLDFLLTCNTVSAVWLTVSLFHTSGMSCLLNIRLTALS